MLRDIVYNLFPIGISILFAPFLLTYLLTWLRGTIAAKRTGTGKTPPIVPYMIPFVGNLFPFIFNTCNFIDVNSERFGKYVPVSFRILNRKLHLISGRDSILALFKHSRDTTTAASTVIVLEILFGSPPSKRHIYERDDTGVLAEPLPGSRPIEAHNRVYYGTHRIVHASLAGPSLARLAENFIKNLLAEIEHDKNVGFDEWVDIPDFYSFIRDKVFKASTSALCGPHIFRLNPTLTADFWKFDSYVPRLFKSTPRFMIPDAYEVRDSLHAQVKKWHKLANEHANPNSIKIVDLPYEEYFGARVMRERYQMFQGIDDFGEDAAAASDLGMIWAANANIVPLVGFAMLDILCRPDVETRVRTEISSTNDPSFPDSLSIDMPKLLSSALLQSIYSEELRLRNAVMIQRTTLANTVMIGDYRFPKGDMIVASSWHEARDRSVWNEGTETSFHSVEDFWADRFILYPHDPTSGPGRASSSKGSRGATAKSVDKPQFSTEAVSGSLIPYGGGQKICPGRFYAKQEAIGSVALLLKAYDIQLDPGQSQPEPNMEFFPFGVVQPTKAFRAKVRRRRYGLESR